MGISNLISLSVGDFMLNDTALYFDSSSIVNDTRCLAFDPVNDDIVEAAESFYFNVSTSNELDIILNDPRIQVAIYDDDGKYNQL